MVLQALLREVGGREALEFRDPQGYTPLLAASAKGNAQCVDLVSATRPIAGS